MATLLNSESRRLYSWWWDSHICPRNSKWLQENLTDMDAKVKAMIKLIEEDADSFARRAEMYYKKRPELMKLVEDLYRAYRALAERYDHATIELRQAQRTMAEAFPNHVPYELADDSSSGSSGPEAEPHTSEIRRPILAMMDPDDLHKGAQGLSSTSLHSAKRSGGKSEEFDFGISKRGLKQMNELFGSRDAVPRNSDFAEGRMRKGLNGNEAETEIQTLKKALEEIQNEKEAILLQYKQSLEKLSHLERELNHALKDAGGLDERASKAEIEIKILKAALVGLESERDAGILQYNQCLERISSLENTLSLAQEKERGLNERAVRAETESQCLKQELSRLEVEKDAGLLHYKQCLEKISVLETKISLAEENARLLNEQIEKAENEVKNLEEALTKLNEEKEATAFLYKQCLDIISKMEDEISHSQEDTRRLNSEILLGATKLKSAEEQCDLLERSNQSLQLKANNLAQKIAVKDQELSEKHHELEKLQTLMQEEHARFKQAEATLLALQKLHSQSQEEQRALVNELKNGLQMLKDVEICKHGMEEELQRVKEENRSLNEENVSSSYSMKNLQNEIFTLKAMKEKIEEEVKLKADQSNALHLEIHHLKEEMAGLNGRHQAIMEQVESVGLTPECLASFVKDLQDENSKLKEICQKERDEREALHEKLKQMDELSKQNAILESSLPEMNVELEGLRERVKNLQESCHLLHEDKSTLTAEKGSLLSQLQILTDNMQKLLEKNTMLENSLSGANLELEGLRANSKSLEELCQLLSNEKSNLLNERGTLVSQLENVEWRLGNLENRFTRLEEKCSDLEKEKEFTHRQVVELQGSLITEKQERVGYTQSSEARFMHLENEIQVLQDASRLGKKGFEEELDRAVIAQVEIFILQKFIEDLEEKNLSLLIERQKHIEASKFSDKLITELESENLEQQVEAEFLLDEIQKLRLAFHRVFRAIHIDPKNVHVDENEQEHIPVLDILDGIEDLKGSLLRSEDEKQQRLVENSVLSTLLGQLRLEFAEVESGKKFLEHEFEVMTEQCALLQKNEYELEEMNKQLKLERDQSEQREDVLKAELKTAHVRLVNLEDDYQALQEDNYILLEEKKSLVKKLLDLNKEKDMLEEENSSILHETAALSNLSLLFENFTTEKCIELEALAENISSLNVVNSNLNEKVEMLGTKMETKEAENLHLNESVEKLGRELNEAKDLTDQLFYHISIGEDFLRQKATELSEAERKLKSTENWNLELCGTVDELNMEREESKIVRDNLEKKVLEVLEYETVQEKEIESLREANESMESEVELLHQEIGEHRIREDYLSSELQEKRDEFELWESEATTFYFDLQISSIREALLEDKVQELAGVCDILEDETATKTMEIENMKAKIGFLESESGGLKAQLSAYVPVIASLGDDITSLEHNVLLHKSMAGYLEEEDKEMVIHLPKKSCLESKGDHSTVMPDGIADLQKLQNRIKEVEKTVVEEMERFSTHESIKTNIKVDAITDTEELEERGATNIKVDAMTDTEELEERGITSIKVDAMTDTEELEERGATNIKVDAMTYTEELEERGITSIKVDAMTETEELEEKVSTNIKVDAMTETEELEEKVATSIKVDAMTESEELEEKVATSVKVDAMTETEELEVKGPTNIKVDAMTETEELEVKGPSHQENRITKEAKQNSNDLTNDEESQQSKPENEDLMKDIPLDQVSDNTIRGRCRRDDVGADDQMLELWEAAEQDYSPTIRETQKRASAPTEDIIECQKFDHERRKSHPLSSEVQVEKDVGIDKLEISSSAREPAQLGNKGRILERLASDSQKLMSLQTTLQDLKRKRKMEMHKRNKKTTEMEYETVKRRLQEVEEALLQLVDNNGKLTKEIEDSSLSVDGRPSGESETGDVCAKQVLEQAGKGSEKIGRLQFELQSIDYVLLKLADNQKSRGKYRFSKSRTGVLLRDFIYSNGRSGERRRKACLCGCTRPSTNE